MARDKKSILMIIPNLDFGGAQRDFCKVANGLSQGYNVSVVAFNSIDVPFELVSKICFMNIPAGSNIILKAVNFLKRVQFLRNYKRVYKVDISISYLEGANYINVLSQRSEKTIISARGSILFDETIHGFVGFFRKRIMIPLLYNRADEIVALNKGIQNELYDSLRVRKPTYSVISNGYDISGISKLSKIPLNNEQSKFFENPVLLSAGRLALEKGYKHLIDVFASAKANQPNLKLALIGDGPEKSVLKEFAKAKGLTVYDIEASDLSDLETSDLALFGYQKNPYQFISRAAFFAITSSSEGGPNVLLEAMICKTIVLSVDCPTGPRERIAPATKRPIASIQKVERNEYGILLPMLNRTNNTSSIAEWVKTIVEFSEEGKRKPVVENAYKHVSLVYDEMKIIEKWMNIVKGSI